MPARKLRLPDLAEHFSVRDALDAGATPAMLRHASLTRTFHGVRSTHTFTSSDVTSKAEVLLRARALAPRLRKGEAVSHTTALLAFGAPIRREPTLHVLAQPGYTRNRTDGVIGHESSAPFAVAQRDNIPVVPPFHACAGSATILPMLELIVAIDHLILPRGFSREAFISLAAFTGESALFRGQGARALRRALEFVRVGAESRMETLTRLLLVAFSLDEFFVLQQEIFDTDGWIGRFDFVCESLRVIVEFDGDHHRTDKSQYEKDLRRLDRARAAGYHVIRLLSTDVISHPRRTAARIAQALGVDVVEIPNSHKFLAR